MRRTQAESCLGREEIQGGNVTKGKMRQKSDLEIIQRPLSGVVGTQPGWSGAWPAAPWGQGRRTRWGQPGEFDDGKTRMARPKA